MKAVDFLLDVGHARPVLLQLDRLFDYRAAFCDAAVQLGQGFFGGFYIEIIRKLVFIKFRLMHRHIGVALVSAAQFHDRVLKRVYIVQLDAGGADFGKQIFVDVADMLGYGVLYQLVKSAAEYFGQNCTATAGGKLDERNRVKAERYKRIMAAAAACVLDRPFDFARFAVLQILQFDSKLFGLFLVGQFRHVLILFDPSGLAGESEPYGVPDSGFALIVKADKK